MCARTYGFKSKLGIIKLFSQIRRLYNSYNIKLDIHSIEYSDLKCIKSNKNLRGEGDREGGREKIMNMNENAG